MREFELTCRFAKQKKFSFPFKHTQISACAGRMPIPEVHNEFTIRRMSAGRSALASDFVELQSVPCD